MKVMFISAEVAPFSKAGGLGEVVGSLPKALEKAGVTCAIFTPLYGCVDIEKYDIKEIPNSKIKLTFDKSEYFCTLKMGKLPDTDVNVFFIDNKKYFSSFDTVYPPTMDVLYEHERYVILSKAALEYAKLLNFKPDAVHLNDWHTAIAAAYLRTNYKNDEFFMQSKIIFSIHNLAYQGIYYQDILEFAGLPEELFVPEGVEKYGAVNWLKGGINLSDKIVAVSPRYAQEIQTEEFGCGLDWSLREHSNKIVGILNGIDYSIYNPKTDESLVKQFDLDTVENKLACKKEICEIFGLNFDENVPLIGMVSRLVEQKGFELLLRIKKELKSMNAQFIILGSGDKKYEQALAKLASGSRNIRINTEYSDEISRKIYAGSDLFLMPSHFEPCGLSQLIAMKYGALPIVRAVGGLENTVTGYPLDGATGFKFWRYEPEDILECMNIALNIFHDKNTRLALIKNAMQSDFSWEKSAQEYVKVYEQ